MKIIYMSETIQLMSIDKTLAPKLSDLLKVGEVKTIGSVPYLLIKE
jgi:hypothetical protein|tara:strand:+ start:533 stop:670 length:138 start_codon:yes stop_codon:yes gene_type:complete